MRKRPRSRAGRVLMWILLIVLVLIVLSLMFGGFQKGTKATGPGALPLVSAPAMPPRRLALVQADGPLASVTVAVCGCPLVSVQPMLILSPGWCPMRIRWMLVPEVT